MSTASLAIEDAGPLTVYSGRSESLVGPVLEAFTDETGVEVEVKYADTAELAALLLEEGTRSPADVFFAQDAGALGAVAAAGLLEPVPGDVLARVPAAFRDPDGRWVGVSGRARTVAYTTAEPVELPASILDFTDPEWSGRIGWAPANGSFQSFVTALRATEGDEAARAWLEGILANDAVDYPSNTAAVEGVAAGEVDVALREPLLPVAAAGGARRRLPGGPALLLRRRPRLAGQCRRRGDPGLRPTSPRRPSP